MSKTRTFIAIEAIDSVHASAITVIDRLRSATDNVKWVEPDNLHWTLQFLGDLGDVEMAEVCLRTVRVAAKHEGFALEATGDSEKLDEFVDVMRSYGEIEVTRSGMVGVSLEPRKLRLSSPVPTKIAQTGTPAPVEARN